LACGVETEAGYNERKEYEMIDRWMDGWMDAFKSSVDFFLKKQNRNTFRTFTSSFLLKVSLSVSSLLFFFRFQNVDDNRFASSETIMNDEES